jgi:hypothetical protein
MPNIFVQTSNDDSSSSDSSSSDENERERNLRRDIVKGGLSFSIEGHDYSGTTGLQFYMRSTSFGFEHYVQFFTPEQLWEAKHEGYFVSLREQDIPQVHKEDVAYLAKYKAIHGLNVERPRTP